MTPAMARLLRVLFRLGGLDVPFDHNRPPPAPGYRSMVEGTIRVKGHDRPFRRVTLRRLEDAGYATVERHRTFRDGIEYGDGELRVTLTTAGLAAHDDLPERAGWA